MKPDWKDAPEWANWLAMDSDGEWTWFDIEPELYSNNPYSVPEWFTKGCKYKNACSFDDHINDWTETLEIRPIYNNNGEKND